VLQGICLFAGTRRPLFVQECRQGEKRDAAVAGEIGFRISKGLGWRGRSGAPPEITVARGWVDLRAEFGMEIVLFGLGGMDGGDWAARRVYLPRLW